MKKQALGTACVALAASGWGTWALFLRGHGLPAAWQSLMILSVIAVCAAPMAVRDSLRRGPRGAAAWGLLGLCALTDAGNYYCYFGALDKGPIALAVLTHYLAPVVVAAFAPLVLREALTLRTRIALGVSLGGLLLLVLGDGGLPRASVWTALMGASSAIFYGLNTLVAKKLFDVFSGAEVLCYHCIVAAGLIALTTGPAPLPQAFLWSPLLGALLLGAGSSSLFYLGLRFIPASRAAVLTYLEPLVAALVGYVFFAEPLGLAGIAGGALIVGAGAVVAIGSAPRNDGVL